MLNKVLRFNNSLAASSRRLMSTFHKSQADQLDATLTVVDHEDNILGETTKLAGHEKAKIPFGNTNRYIEHPHRAFSLFLFNENNELLVQ